MANVFDELNALNINGHTEKKKSGNTELTYLSWPWAWAEVKKRHEDASYTIWKDEHNRPYILDPETGYMVYTSVTISGITHEMWLPVMDGSNKAMRNEGYDYKVKNPNFRYARKQPDGRYLDSYGNEQPEYVVKHCEAASMMDINKTIMRCLVKNLAMFGLGLYLYAGEDLPESEQKESEQPGPEFTRPDVNEKNSEAPKSEEPSVTSVAKIPPVQPKVVPIKKEEKNPVLDFLTASMIAMREQRGISAQENNKLFKAQRDALVNAKLAPDKKLEEYTMEEAEALIDAMYKCFKSTKGTELKTE